jgi:hypothetical protein
MDLFGDQATTSDALLFDSDRRLIVEIIFETCSRIDELQTSFRAHLYAENCLKQNRSIINEILRQHFWLTTNDMPFYL